MFSRVATVCCCWASFCPVSQPPRSRILPATFIRSIMIATCIFSFYFPLLISPPLSSFTLYPA
ncbi:hypothetical protein BDV29DRAFT_9595 [Aspergillus leporis]|uniref:Uncharacterized protein n=1 Tax=Aspergillus leporis TaxID=41062 RepID=A0A5N5XE44_9EURO|nr:hypothetical protein BDV29DRAFT_9595 [Aspergillus leporis]